MSLPREANATKAFTEWLAAAGLSPTSVHCFSQGRLHSVRWELKEPPNPTLLQVTLVPCTDGSPFVPSFRLLVYSLMPEEETEQLRKWLQSIPHGGSDLSLFQVTARGCKRLL